MTESHAETPLGWLRLAVGPVLYGLVPLWFLGGLVMGQLLPGLSDGGASFGFLVGLACSAVAIGALGLAIALLVFGWVAGSRAAQRWRERRDFSRYEAIIGDGSVMRANAWPDPPVEELERPLEVHPEHDA